MSLRARLLAGMAVVSFVLVAAAVIVARTTQSEPRRPRRPAAGVGRPAPSPVPPAVRPRFCGRARSRTGSITVRLPAQREQRRVRPRPRSRSPTPSAPRATHEPFTVGSASGSGRYRMLASRAPDGSITLIGLSLQDVDATMSRLRLVLIAAVAMVIAILGARRVLGAAPRRAADQADDPHRGGDRRR